MLPLDPDLALPHLRPVTITRPAPARALRVSPTRAPRLAPTWAPHGGITAADLLTGRVPPAPRLPADLVRGVR